MDEAQRTKPKQAASHLPKKQCENDFLLKDPYVAAAYRELCRVKAEEIRVYARLVKAQEFALLKCVREQSAVKSGPCAPDQQQAKQGSKRTVKRRLRRKRAQLRHQQEDAAKKNVSTAGGEPTKATEPPRSPKGTVTIKHTSEGMDVDLPTNTAKLGGKDTVGISPKPPVNSDQPLQTPWSAWRPTVPMSAPDPDDDMRIIKRKVNNPWQRKAKK